MVFGGYRALNDGFGGTPFAEFGEVDLLSTHLQAYVGDRKRSCSVLDENFSGLLNGLQKYHISTAANQTEPCRCD